MEADTRGLNTNTQALHDAALTFFLRTGDNPTASDLATEMQCSVSKVNKMIREGRGVVKGLEARAETRTSYSKNFRAMESGVHRVWTYGPSRECLRSAINSGTGKCVCHFEVSR